MSEEDKTEDKPLKGFANPELRKNINRAGRRKGALNKIPTDAAIKESFKKGSTEALQVLQKIMRNGAEANQVKCAFKILDTTMSIIQEEEKLKIKKTKDDGSSEEYTAESKKEATGEKVVKFLKKS